jgi:hypothetical protein
MTPRKTGGAIAPGGARSAVPGDIGINTRVESPKDGTVTDRARLEALRSRLEGVLDDAATSPRDVAAVSREYRQTLDALAKLAPADAVSLADEIAARRRKRGSR